MKIAKDLRSSWTIIAISTITKWQMKLHHYKGMVIGGCFKKIKVDEIKYKSYFHFF